MQEQLWEGYALLLISCDACVKEVAQKLKSTQK